MKSQRNTIQMKEKTRNTEVQINEEEIGKLPVESLIPTRDQALSLWGGSSDSKIPDYQRANHREHQIVRTHIKETT